MISTGRASKIDRRDLLHVGGDNSREFTVRSSPTVICDIEPSNSISTGGVEAIRDSAVADWIEIVV